VLINVSTLLNEPLGNTRVYDVTDEPASVPGQAYARSVSGRVRLIRSERGVLVWARLRLEVPLECARCLKGYAHPVSVEFTEEFIDPQSERATARGQKIDPEDFKIDQWRHLDLSEAIRQYEESARPIVPVCREDCEGLCPSCGQDLNEARCSCPGGQVEDHWGALAGLAERLKEDEEKRNGRPEA
jgi:uncharacterized protein